MPAAFLGWTLIPLLGIGITMMRYNSVDPETHPIDQREVCYTKIHSNFVKKK